MSAWLAWLTQYVLAQLPPAPARVLELGCGREGGFVPALAAAGYDVVGVDPQAPDGAHFRQQNFEEYAASPGGATGFDAVVASLSLHHVEDVERTVAALADKLVPGGVAVVVELAWERHDDATAEWWAARLGPTPPELESAPADAGHPGHAPHPGKHDHSKHDHSKHDHSKHDPGRHDHGGHQRHGDHHKPGGHHEHGHGDEPGYGDGISYLHRHRAAWRESGRTWEAYFREWAAEHGMHPAAEVIAALDRHFSRRDYQAGPYLFPELPDVTEQDERDAIAAGLVQPLCVRYVGSHRAGAAASVGDQG